LRYQELFGYWWRSLCRSNRSLVCSHLSPQLLNLLLEFSVSLHHSFHAARSTTLLQLLHLLLQAGNMFLGPLPDVSLGFSVVCSFPCQLGFTQVTDRSFSPTGTLQRCQYIIHRLGRNATNLSSWAHRPPSELGCLNFDYLTLRT